MHPKSKALATYLATFVTTNKLNRIETILTARTRYFTVVLEDIYQPHNISAVLRSAECLGVQDIHIIEQHNKYQLNRDIALGANKWLTLKRYRKPNTNNTLECLNTLKAQGYQIAAATLNPNSIPIDKLSLHKKTALCFGSEELGLTQTAHEIADVSSKIPMYGFTQSFNISVSAAICMYTLITKLKNSEINWHLTTIEQLELKIAWLINSIPNGAKIAAYFNNQIQKN